MHWLLAVSLLSIELKVRMSEKLPSTTCPPFLAVVPVLLLLAEHDRIIDNARTRRYVEKFAGSDSTVVELPGTHHTLEFEPDPTPAFADVAAWLRDHQGGQSLGGAS